MLRRLLVLTAVLSGQASVAQVPGVGDVESVTLANGMQIIVWPDRDIPNVAFYNWVRVGSRNEAPGITGLAHFFEHMMFNGTSTRAPGEFDRTLEAKGARNNAFTSSDVTVYQDWFPRVALETVFELEADRLRNLAFDPKVIESERGVVHSERRLRVDDSHFGRLQEQVQATAFRGASVRHSHDRLAVGHRDLESRKPQDLLQDVLRAEQLHDRAGRRRRRRRASSRSRASTSSRCRRRTRRRRCRRRSPLNMASAAYRSTSRRRPRSSSSRITASQAPMHANLRSICSLEFSPTATHRACIARSSRNRRWRSPPTVTRRAVSIPASYGSCCRCPANGDLAKAEAAFTQEIERVIKDGVTVEEVARARNQALADFWRGLATIDGKAAALGDYAVLRGGYEKLFEAPKAYEA